MIYKCIILNNNSFFLNQFIVYSFYIVENVHNMFILQCMHDTCIWFVTSNLQKYTADHKFDEFPLNNFYTIYKFSTFLKLPNT